MTRIKTAAGHVNLRGHKRVRVYKVYRIAVTVDIDVGQYGELDEQDLYESADDAVLQALTKAEGCKFGRITTEYNGFEPADVA